ncbi:MAG: hypothetical protein OEZ58_19975 [Gammaproteobacteria bacterium]|nr:hypothetical protein [Gammaproteobacteria bacterium]MDH5731269.1 hypothetical protein [Gammaproteobacteria bacterium]
MNNNYSFLALAVIIVVFVLSGRVTANSFSEEGLHLSATMSQSF